MTKKSTCGSPWGCSNQTSHDEHGQCRTVDGASICRACYQYVWENCRQYKKAGVMSFMSLEGPRRPLERRESTCSREGCTRELKPGTGQAFRVINNQPICQPCYQAAWELSKKRSVPLATARKEMLAKKPRK